MKKGFYRLRSKVFLPITVNISQNEDSVLDLHLIRLSST